MSDDKLIAFPDSSNDNSLESPPELHAKEYLKNCLRDVDIEYKEFLEKTYAYLLLELQDADNTYNELMILDRMISVQDRLNFIKNNKAPYPHD